MGHVNISILILLVIATTICIVIGIQDARATNLPKLPEVTKDVYATLEGLDRESAIESLSKWAERAKRIVPEFPDFPGIWIPPPADKGQYRSLGERYCIDFLHLLFPGKEFKTVRPTWLRNPKTKKCLELDGYCEELSLAIEYNGIQHYVWPNFTPMTRDEFFEQRYRDQVKVDVCTERHICLLRIPYTVPIERIPLAVYAKLLEAVPGLH